MHSYYSIPWPIRLRVRLRLAAAALSTKLKALVGVKPRPGFTLLVGFGNSGRLSPETSRHVQEAMHRIEQRSTILPADSPQARQLLNALAPRLATKAKGSRRQRRRLRGRQVKLAPTNLPGSPR